VSSDRHQAVFGFSETDVYVTGYDGPGYTGYLLHYDGADWTRTLTDAAGFTLWGSDSSALLAAGRDGVVWKFDGTTLQTARQTPPTYNAIFGAADDAVFAVGEDGAVVHYDGANWVSTKLFTEGVGLRDVWAASPTDVFAVGDAGAIAHFDGTAWAEVQTSITDDLRCIYGFAADDIYAAGYEPSSTCRVYHFDGQSWTEDSTIDATPICLWGTQEGDLWMSGGFVFAKFDGTSWEQTYTSNPYNGLWGASSSRVWGCTGMSGGLDLYDGTNWTHEWCCLGTALRAIHGTSDSDIFTVGGHGGIVHFDGSQWTQDDTQLWATLWDVWCAPGGDVFVVGEQGLLLHVDR
jgi:hypothetical protein